VKKRGLLYVSFSTDESLTIISWDNEIERFTGKTSSSVLGKKYFEVFPRILADGTDAVSAVLEKKKALTLKGYSFHCLFGQTRADIRIKPAVAADGEKYAEVRIAAGSACSVVENLRRSQQLINIGKTASALAHGVRNPLNAIKGAVVYLSERYAQEAPLIEFMTIMEEEIARLDSFISKFLSTSLSDAERTLTDINALLRRLEIFTSLQAKSYEVTTHFEYGKIRPVVINAFQIEQAILNVVNNALEAMRHSGGRLTVRAYQERNSGGDFLVIEVSDTGPGIDESRIDALAVPSEPEKEGRGFGLFIAREILQYYGGYLDIKSRRGKGTTMRLFLPADNASGRK
jgi:two-component system nitrogen regulation sensor histidine kinase GlnL